MVGVAGPWPPPTPSLFPTGPQLPLGQQGGGSLASRLRAPHPYTHSHGCSCSCYWWLGTLCQPPSSCPEERGSVPGAERGATSSMGPPRAALGSLSQSQPPRPGRKAHEQTRPQSSVHILKEEARDREQPRCRPRNEVTKGRAWSPPWSVATHILLQILLQVLQGLLLEAALWEGACPCACSCAYLPTCLHPRWGEPRPQSSAGRGIETLRAWGLGSGPREQGQADRGPWGPGPLTDWWMSSMASATS